LREEPADILQSQHFYTNAYAAVAAWLLNCKGIGALRSNGQFDLTQCGRIGGRINLHLPGILAANSRSSIQYAMNRGIESSRLHFLPNVVDTEQFTPAEPNLAPGDRSEPLTLLAVGRLTREKRFDRFISILHKLRVSGLDVRGWIVGSSRVNENLRPELEQQAAALGLLPDALQFLGSASDMGAIYRRSSICVLTSDHEGTPNVLLEAMAAGLPIVATNVGGIPEFVKNGQTGFLIDREDLEAQTTVIARLIRDSDLRTSIGNQARGYIEQNHSLHRLPALLNDLYEAALPPNRKHYAASVMAGPDPQVARNRPPNPIKEQEVYEH
jgi:glycosyltransferase involved in cell wall biosynthesis